MSQKDLKNLSVNIIFLTNSLYIYLLYNILKGDLKFDTDLTESIINESLKVY